MNPDCDLVTATAVTAGNAGDAAVASGLLVEAMPAGGGDRPAGRQAAAARPHGLSSNARSCRCARETVGRSVNHIVNCPVSHVAGDARLMRHAEPPGIFSHGT